MSMQTEKNQKASLDEKPVETSEKTEEKPL